MIVLHAGVRQDRLLLWGEAPSESRAARGRPAPHPYHAWREKLAEALVETGWGFVPGRRDFREAIAWLPTQDGYPLSSSPLIAPVFDASAQPVGATGRPPKGTEIAPWVVTALDLDAGRAISLLCACAGKQVLKPGVVIGADVAYWTAAMRFAGGIVAREQLLPDLVKRNGSYRACWKPVFAGADAERMAQLAGSMPASSRALTLEATAPPETPARSVVSDFVAGIVDYLVRSSKYATPPLRSTKQQRIERTPEFDSIHDHWLDALHSLDGAMEGDPARLAGFAAQVRDWQRPIRVTAGAPFRLCFRLEEPSNGEGTWYVRYLVQSTSDRSLLVPAAEAWTGKRSRILAKGREYLLAALGRAAGICPRIENSLKKPLPEGYEVDATGAHEFLTEKAGSLEQSGFGVLLPAWWTRKGTKLRLAARANVKSPSMQGGAGLSLDTVVKFDWEIALGQEKLSRDELLALAALKSPLVKVRGQWVELNAEEIQAALEFWKRKSSATARDIVQMALGAKTPDGIGFEGVTATGWLGDLLAQLEGSAGLEQLPVPEGFRGELRPYQARGYSWLGFLRRWGLGACLADDMGLGKTIQTLALIERQWTSNGKRPVLLICPTSVVRNWQKEASRFTPELPVMVHHGAARTRSAAFREQAEKHAIVISSYALLQRDFEILKEAPWSGVILDEAQNIKNPETKQARAARALPSEYRIALTGTPVENNVGELWSIMEFLNPGFLGNEAQFKERFFIPIQAAHDRRAAERLKRLTGPFLLRRLKTDKSIIADLPEKMEMKVFCTLTREQASLYAAVVQDATERLEAAEGIQRRGVILATLSKLKQVCNHPAHFLGDNSAIAGRSGKLARLTEMIEEVLEVGDRALIFSQFWEMGEILRRHLEETFGREALFLHGGVSKKQRDQMVDRFQDDEGGPPIFILSLKAGGTGLNLTRANHVFHFDRWWNPAVENQATDRAFRIGQTRNVQVHKFLCAGTLEEKIDEMIERKKEIAENVVGAGEAWLTELSTAELKELLALRKEAVEE